MKKMTEGKTGGKHMLNGNSETIVHAKDREYFPDLDQIAKGSDRMPGADVTKARAFSESNGLVWISNISEGLAEAYRKKGYTIGPPTMHRNTGKPYFEDSRGVYMEAPKRGTAD